VAVVNEEIGVERLGSEVVDAARSIGDVAHHYRLHPRESVVPHDTARHSTVRY
jgi:hypothetical protein